MKRFRYLSLAVASLLVATFAAAATQPHYGGVLHIETSAALNTLDPAQDSGFPPDSAVRAHVAMLIFDRLVMLDASLRPQPGLGTSWEHDPDLRRWQFHLRRNVRLHDGSLLSARLVVSALSAANPGWHVRVFADDVAIDSDSPLPNLLAELALPRNSIVARAADGTLIGSGAFRVAQWQSGQKIVLAANEDYWGGRPYLDRIEIVCARALKDQALDLQLNRADVVEISPEQLRRTAQDNQRLVTSSPAGMIGLVFSDRKTVQDARVRQALSLAIDRTAIRNTLLQGQGEPTADFLPQWCSGYSFLAPVAVDLVRARQLIAETSAQNTPLTIAYDWSDPLARVMAERIAVNAHDAGLNVQAYGENLAQRSANADARIVRVPLMSSDPAAALAGIAHALGIDAQKIEAAAAPEDLLAAGRAARQGSNFLPIVYVPEAYGLSARVRNWSEPREGGWPAADVWVEMQRP